MRKRKLISTLTAASIVLQIGAPVFAYDDQQEEGSQPLSGPRLFQSLVDFSGNAGVWDIVPMGTNGQDVQDNVVMLRGVPADKISGGGEYHADYIFNGNGPVKPADGDIYGDIVFGNDALLAWDDGVTRTHGDYYFLGDSRQDAKNSFKMNVNGSKHFQDNGFVFFNRILNTNDIISQSLAASSTNRFLLMSGGAGYADLDSSLLQGSGSYTGMLYDRITASQESDLSDLNRKAFKYYDYLKYGIDEYPVYDSVANYIENSDPNENIMSLNEFASRYSYGNSHSFVPSGSYTISSGSRIGDNHNPVFFFLEGSGSYSFNITSDLDLTGVAFVVLNGEDEECARFILNEGVDLTYEGVDNSYMGQGFISVSPRKAGKLSPADWLDYASSQTATTSDPTKLYDSTMLPSISIYGKGSNKINLQRFCTVEAYVGLFDHSYDTSESGLYITDGHMVNFYGRLMTPNFSSQNPLSITYCPAPDAYLVPLPTDVETPTPVDTNTPVPEPTVITEPTISPIPRDTNTPTPGPIDTDTPTPEPTDTNTPTPEPTDTNTPTPEPTVTNTPTPGPTVTEIPLPVYDNPLFRHQLEMTGTSKGFWDLSFGKNAPENARDNTALAREVPQRSIGGSPERYTDFIFKGNGAVIMPDGRFHGDTIFGENASWDMTYSHGFEYDGDTLFFGKPGNSIKDAFSNPENGIVSLLMNNLVLLNRSVPDSQIMAASMVTRRDLPNLFMRGQYGSYIFDDSLVKCMDSNLSSIMTESYDYFNSAASDKIKQKTRYYEAYLDTDDSEYPTSDEVISILDKDDNSSGISMTSAAFVNAYGSRNKSSAMFIPAGEYHIKDSGSRAWNSGVVDEPGDVIYFFIDGSESYKFYLESDYDLTGVVFVVLNKNNSVDAAFILNKDVDINFNISNLEYGYASGFVSASSDRSESRNPDLWLDEVASDRKAAANAEQYYTSDNRPEIYILGLGNNTINFARDGVLEAYVGLFDQDYASSASEISFLDTLHMHVFGRFMTPNISSMNPLYVNYCPAPDEWKYKEPVPMPTDTNTPTPVATETNTPTPEPTVTNTSTPMPTDTNTPTPEPTETNTPTPEPTSTNTPTPEPTASNTPTVTNTPTPEPTSTNTPTPTVTNTPTPEPTATNTPTPEPTETNTPTPEPTATNTPTPEPTATNTPVPPTATSTPTPEPTEADEPEPTPAIKKVKVEAEVDEDEIELNWNKIKKVTGYKIYRKTGNGDYKLIKTIKSSKRTNYSDEDVKNGKTYTYKVVGYKGDFEGSGKEAKIFYLEPVVLSKAKNVKPKSIKVTWNSNSKATGYEVTYTLDDKPRSIMIKGSEKTNTTIKKLTKNKSYLISVRAYKTVSGNVYYSDWSDEKSVKIKK